MRVRRLEADLAGQQQVALDAGGVVLERGGRVFAGIPDIRLEPGCSLALTGPSGSGKSTALLALSGIRAPAQGHVLIGDTDLWSLGPAARDRLRGRRIGFVFQTFHLLDAISVVDNLRVAASCAGLRPNMPHVRRLLDRLDIGGLAHRRADRLSQGEAQRVAVARALVNQPAVLLADEPTSALDDGNATSLLALLIELARDHDAALLVATHDRRVLDTVDQAVAMVPLQ